MAKYSAKWVVNAEGVEHHVEYKPKKLIVDGETYKLKSANWFVNLIEYTIHFGDVTCCLVVIGNKVDLAVDGKFLGSGKTYEPVGNIPVVVTVFGAVSTILGFLLNSFIGAAIGALLATLYFNLYLKKKSMIPVVIAFVIGLVGQLALGFAVSMFLLPLYQY